MKFYFPCLSLILLLFSCAESTNPSLPNKKATTSKQVIENYIAAIGGQENIDKLDNMRYTYIAYSKGDSSQAETIRVNGKAMIQRNSPTDYTIYNSADSTGVILLHGHLAAISPNTSKDMEPSTYILDALYDLKTHENIEFLGEKNIGDSLQVYQLKEKLGNGFEQISDYNKTTGLLLRVVIDPYLNNTYKNYTRHNGILFADFVESKDYSIKVTERHFNEKIDKSVFEWNDEKHKKLVGTWVSKNLVSLKNDFFALQLDKNRGGKEFTGIIVPDGTIVEAKYMTQNFAAWEYVKNTLMLSTFDEKTKRWHTRRLKLENQTDSSFDAYPVYLEFDEKSKQNNKDLRTLIMSYKKQK